MKLCISSWRGLVRRAGSLKGCDASSSYRWCGQSHRSQAWDIWAREIPPESGSDLRGSLVRLLAQRLPWPIYRKRREYLRLSQHETPMFPTQTYECVLARAASHFTIRQGWKGEDGIDYLWFCLRYYMVIHLNIYDWICALSTDMTNKTDCSTICKKELPLICYIRYTTNGLRISFNSRKRYATFCWFRLLSPFRALQRSAGQELRGVDAYLSCSIVLIKWSLELLVS